MAIRVAQRAASMPPFYVMEVAKAARQMQAQAGPHAPAMHMLNIGEPDFGAPEAVQAAAQRAMRDGLTQYSPATGIAPLREAIAAWYGQRFGMHIDAQRIVVTAGASAALQLACLALIEAGDEGLMADPGYPCNRQFVRAADGVAVPLPAGPAQRFQLSAEQVAAHWGPRTRGVLLASPSNPTGTSIEWETLQALAQTVRARNGVLWVDEIYLGLSHDERFARTALALPDELNAHVISINSFSKYFGMTGWRLGWLVLPEALVPAVERLAQHLYICPSRISQEAALACFEPESLSIFEQRRAAFKARRDAFIPALQAAGLDVPVMPDGAFYAWADASPWFKAWGVDNSWDFTFELMKRGHMAVAPGRDFGQHNTDAYIRFSTASSMAVLMECAQRLHRLNPR